jgi:hypothetical protein
MQPKLMNFGKSESYKIPELLQLDLRVSIKTAPMCRSVARTDRMLRVTIHVLTYWWNCLREVEKRDKIKTKGRLNK